jgi:RNA polymerase sigma-70 factor (ECF subfamily)
MASHRALVRIARVSKDTFMRCIDVQGKEPCGLTYRELSRLADSDLMVHLRSGHNDALGVLFDRYHRLILSVAFKILRDAAEAEDVMQSIFLEIFRVAEQFDASRGTAKTWLLQYAYHRSMNRKEYLRLRGFYDRGQEGSPQSNSPGFAVEGGTPSLLAPELGCLVQEGLETLNDSQRRTLHMVYFQDMRLKEIARKVGDSLGNVRHHYYRGLGRLRRLFLGSDESRSGERTIKTKYDTGATGSIDAKV